MRRSILVIIVAAAALVAGEPAPTPEQEARLRAERIAKEGSNLRQIYVAMIAYSQEKDTGYPVVVPDGVRAPPASEEQARLIAAASLEHLAQVMDLPPQLFVSASDPQRKLPKPRPLAEIKAKPDPAWAAGYAYDWASPGEPAPFRVMLATRTAILDPRTGKPAVIVVRADGSIARLPVEERSDGTRSAINADAAGLDDESDAAKPLPDDIFDGEGDGPSLGVPEKGSSRRAWVR